MLYKSLNLITDSYIGYDSFYRVYNRLDEKINAGVFISKLVTIVTQVFDVIGYRSSELKKIELMISFVAFVPEAIKNYRARRSKKEFVIKGLAMPLLNLVRIAVEGSLYKEIEKNKSIAIDLKENTKLLGNTKELTQTLNQEIKLKMVTADALHKLSDFMRYKMAFDFIYDTLTTIRSVVLGAYFLNKKMKTRQVFDLAALRRIPNLLHNDIVFSQFICPITLEPIRFAVTDPRSGHNYERADIERWIEENHCSPQTREPLEVNELQANVAIQNLIDNRLLFFTQNFDEYFRVEEEGLNHAPPPALLQPALAADPHGNHQA